jgi:RNA polymerase sigma-70 factor (ECF subfamily)
VEIAVGAAKADVSQLVSAGGTRAEEFIRFAEARRERSVRLAFRLLAGDAATAEDVVQNALLRAHRALPGFRGEASLDTWFYRIVVREVQRERRRQSVRRFLGLESAPEPIDPRPRSDPGLRRRIADALERLSAAQREVFVLVHLEEFTLVEVAELLGKAVGTVKSHLHRALATLRVELADLSDAKSDATEGEES